MKFRICALILLSVIMLQGFVYANSEIKYNQKIVKQGDDVYISFRYKPGMDMHLIIGRCGYNALPNIKKIFVDKNPSDQVSPWVTKASQLLMQSCTDWIGPYVVKSLENDDGGPSCFTGGWHGSNVDGSGLPSARNEHFSVLVDNKPIVNGKVYTGEVDITSINLIQGFNTKKAGIYLLRENTKINVVQGRINVEVETTALENVEILQYYGLQVQNSPWNGTVEYGNGIISGVHRRYSDSGPLKDSGKVNAFILKSPNRNQRLLAAIDLDYGLGGFNNISEDKPCIFTESYGKTYFNLINGKSKRLARGESIGWRGYYEFK